MNEKQDRFEAELYALQPQEISPTLHKRIAASLAADRSAASRRQVAGGVALLAGLIAASLLAAVLWPRGHQGTIPGGPIPTRQDSPPVVANESLPTFRAYQHALTQSPEALEAMMDKYAALSLAANQPTQPVRALPFANADLPN